MFKLALITIVRGGGGNIVPNTSVVNFDTRYQADAAFDSVDKVPLDWKNRSSLMDVTLVAVKLY